MEESVEGIGGTINQSNYENNPIHLIHSDKRMRLLYALWFHNQQQPDEGTINNDSVPDVRNEHCLGDNILQRIKIE